MVIVYRLSPLTYRLAKRFVHVETVGMVNLVAGETIVPELIQTSFTPEAVADEAVSFLTDHERARRTRDALRRVRSKVGRARRERPGGAGRLGRRAGGTEHREPVIVSRLGLTTCGQPDGCTW